MKVRLLLPLLALFAAPVRAADPLVDAPVVWWEDDRNDIPKPAKRDPNLLRDQIHTTLDRWILQNRRDLGSKNQALVCYGIVKRFLSQPITS